VSFRFDSPSPTVTPRKVLDVSRLTELGVAGRESHLDDGYRSTYRMVLAQTESQRELRGMALVEA
jgi:hypothetical protein